MEMKFILALFLCGVAYTTASPTCSESEVSKCNIYNPVSDDDYIATEEYLNSVCKYMGCLKDYKSRCGVESLADYLKSLLNYSEKAHRALCGTNSQALRKKFLANVKCVNRVLRTPSDECRIKETIDFKDPKYCPRIAVSLDCMNDLIERECGQEAREVKVAVHPGLVFYGCEE